MANQVDEIMAIPNSFYDNQDIFYTQFNEVSFFVEDIDQENLYFLILKKLFKDIKITKIFPLGGKTRVIEGARSNLDKKDEIYIVDGDFDVLLGSKTNLDNLFYLEMYSIENYLFEEQSIESLIIAEKPKLKLAGIKSSFVLIDFLIESFKLMKTPTLLCFIAQKNNTGIPNVSLGINHFCDFQKKCTRKSSFDKFKIELSKLSICADTEMKTNDKVVTIEYVPGKFIMEFLMYEFKNIFSINHLSKDSLTYKLANYCDLNSLDFLKDNINSYLVKK